MIQKWPKKLISFLKEKIEFTPVARSEHAIEICYGDYGTNITEITGKN